jgi:hypothetical protein
MMVVPEDAAVGVAGLVDDLIAFSGCGHVIQGFGVGQQIGLVVFNFGGQIN